MSGTQDWARKQKTGGDAYRKVLLRAIADYADWEEGTCWPSIDTLANDCECHPNTVRRRLHELEKLKFISLQKRSGSSYFITLVGYKEWHLGLPVTKIDTPTYQVALPDGEGYLAGSPPLPTREDTPTCQVAEHYHLTTQLTNKRDDRTDSSTTGGVEEKVFYQDGNLKLCESLNQFWLKQFDGNQDDLNLALIQIAGYVQPNSRTSSLEKQTSSQLAKITRERRERDQRYRSAAWNKSNNKKSLKELSEEALNNLGK